MKNYLDFFKESYRRAVAAEGQRDEFLDAFYETFLAKTDEVKEKFANTDMSRQKQMLYQSLTHMLDFSERRQASERLRRIAERHNRRNVDIRPGLYDLWLDSLVDTVAMFDPAFNEEIELAWRVVLAPGVAYMKYKYDHP